MVTLLYNNTIIKLTSKWKFLFMFMSVNLNVSSIAIYRSRQKLSDWAR